MSFPPTDFMDALCDPRAFLSAQEKRGEQLKALGIEEADLDTSHVIQSKGDGAGGKGGDGKGKDGKKDDKPGKPQYIYRLDGQVCPKIGVADPLFSIEWSTTPRNSCPYQWDRNWAWCC